MNLKTKLLFSFLMIGSLLLVNCQVEDLQESASKRNPYAPIVSKEFKEFEKLPGLLSEIIPNHGLSVRNKNTDPRYQFEIDSTAVIQITNNGIAYYTMSITRENQEDGVFENLVVFDDGNEKKAIIVKYKPDASFLSRFELNPDAQFSGKFNMTELERSNLASRLTSATKCFISTHLYCTNNNPPTLAGKGCYTNKDGGAHVKSITYVNCFEIIINEPEPYLNNTFVLNPINDAGGGNPDIATSIATHPVFMGIIDFRFIRRLTPEQKAWWNNANNNAAVAVILNYLKENTSNHSYVNNQLILDGDISSEAKAFAKQFIQNSIVSGLNFNFEKSLESPANIDFTGIDLNTPEGKKLDCIYKTMMTVPAFKDLFQNTFGTNDRINVKFEIADNLPSTLNGNCIMEERTISNNVTIYNNLIRINKNILDSSKSDIFIAKVILHEAIHAYLNIKQANCNNGATLPYLNNLQLGELIRTFYQGFNCHINVNGSAQSQHDFIFNHMIPTFMDVLWGLKDKLISQSHQQQITSDPFYNTTTEAFEPFIWNDFFYNLSLAGLHQTESFINYIENDPEKLQKFNFYNNSAQLLTKNCN